MQTYEDANDEGTAPMETATTKLTYRPSNRIPAGP